MAKRSKEKSLEQKAPQSTPQSPHDMESFNSATEFVMDIYAIDDEPDLLEIISELASPHGFRVRTYIDPTTLLRDLREKSNRETPSAVLADFKMQPMTGVEIAQSIRKFNSDIRIAILTGFADKEMALESLNAGVNDILEKPITSSKLLGILEAYRNREIKKRIEAEDELRALRAIFIEESRLDLIDVDNEILRFDEGGFEPNQMDSLFRRVHSLKGGAATVGAVRLVSFCHSFETTIGELRKLKSKPTAASIDVLLQAADAVRFLLDQLESQNPVSKTEEANLIHVEMQLQQILEKPSDSTQFEPVSRSREKAAESVTLVPDSRVQELALLAKDFLDFQNKARTQLNRHKTIASRLERLTAKLDTLSSELQKTPLDRTLSKLPRLVREMAHKTGKKASLKLSGFEMSVDKKVARALSQSLTHLLRNSIDHGIELPIERIDAGKSESGLINVTAMQESNELRIVIEDDGRGLDRKKIRERLESSQLKTRDELRRLRDDELDNSIFLPGLSTASSVTEISGRGIGMDAVKTLIESLKGKIEIESQSGLGTKVSIVVPLLETRRKLSRKKMKPAA